MKSRKIFFSMLICMAILIGCGKKNEEVVPQVSEEVIGSENTSQENQTQESQEDKSYIEENQVQENQTEESIFAEFKNLNFTFLSGAGGWSTEMTIAEDGTFKGTYHDSEMGSATEEYPNGTYYFCSFQGKFAEAVQKEEYVYSTTIESISYDNPPGTEEIKDGMRYIYSEAYGLDDPKEILIYLPGMPIEDLPEGYLSWVRSNWAMDFEFTSNSTTLPFYGIYNVNSEQGFSSYDIIEILEQSLSNTETTAEDLENSIMNDVNLTQADLNEKSYWLYQVWDNTLNEIWEILKRNLSSEDMKDLTEEQLDWIALKETSMKEAGAEFEGGSMYGMVVSQNGAKLTKERVYELMEMVEEIRE